MRRAQGRRACRDPLSCPRSHFSSQHDPVSRADPHPELPNDLSLLPYSNDPLLDPEPPLDDTKLNLTPDGEDTSSVELYKDHLEERLARLPLNMESSASLDRVPVPAITDLKRNPSDISTHVPVAPFPPILMPRLGLSSVRRARIIQSAQLICRTCMTATCEDSSV